LTQAKAWHVLLAIDGVLISLKHGLTSAKVLGAGSTECGWEWSRRWEFWYMRICEQVKKVLGAWRRRMNFRDLEVRM
jgi:hypothetical protein